MLPLLPALILLLLNGPANIERLAEGGALPAALAAIQQRVSAPQSQMSQARADQYAFASLLSLSGDPQLSRALAQIFSINVACEAAPSAQPEKLLADESSGEPPPITRSIGKPHQGFLDSQRSRDGPLSC